MCKNCIAFLIVLLVVSCSPVKDDSCIPNTSSDLLFSRLCASETGIDFGNYLDKSQNFDVFRYRNYYNGGGVAFGDIDNDGLSDVYLTSNTDENKLYLNKGDFQFEDISGSSGTEGTKAWSTGVSMADVNGDGLLDIYVCNSGNIEGDNKENELFINNGDLTFTEKAAEFGLADQGFSTHAAFFDYDRDGDLDLYLLNNSFKPISTLGYRNIRDERDPLGGDKLYRNEGEKFVDVSDEAGIFGSLIGFGLGITIGDFNQDNWPDIYISNDFFERDYLYINKGDGTFSEELTSAMGHISLSSMGADAADINNDGLPEIFVTDMLPESDDRIKTVTTFESPDVYQIKQDNDYYHQVMRNTLQRNNGDGTFSEIGWLAGVSATDWSWGALIADFDNDRRKDIYVTNGIFKDVTDQDFVNYLYEENIKQLEQGGSTPKFSEWLDKIPSNKLSNFMFTRTSGSIEFENKSSEWGLDEPSFSNGAAYGDLDNDGDLDLITSNVNMDLFVYRNQTETLLENNFIKLKFEGSGKNTFGVGARVWITLDDEDLYYEHMPMRGFQSSMEYGLTIGLGDAQDVDQIRVTWPSGKVSVMNDLNSGETIIFKESEASEPESTDQPVDESLFSKLTDNAGIEYEHNENSFADFDREKMLYHQLSTEGPGMAKGDLNNDGLEDIFIGGAKESIGAIYLQQRDGSFRRAQGNFLEGDAIMEDVDAAIVDINGDGQNDLYVVSGGNEYSPKVFALADRIYLNRGSSGTSLRFEKAGDIPVPYESGACVDFADYDKDGDLDIFIGSRSVPFRYGIKPDSYILENKGGGNFEDVSSEVAPSLKELGLVKDAAWVDVDEDQDPDLVVVGDWMPVTILLNDNGKFTHTTIPGSEGWWNRVESADLDNDGDSDLVLGNYGRNSKFSASEEEPLYLYVNDFDQNRTIDQIQCFTKDGKIYPYALRHDLVNQINALKKKYVYYKDYVGQTIQDIFTPEQLELSIVHKAVTLNTSIAVNNGSGSFEIIPLPEEAQVSPVYGITTDDFDGDSIQDILVTGNFSGVKPEVGKHDSNYGLLLKGMGNNEYEPQLSKTTGFRTIGDIRSQLSIETQKGKLIILGKNDQAVEVFKVNE